MDILTTRDTTNLRFYCRGCRMWDDLEYEAESKEIEDCRRCYSKIQSGEIENDIRQKYRMSV